MIVDVEHHLITKVRWEKSGGKKGVTVLQRDTDGTILKPLNEASWNVDIHLEHMDRAGIDMAVVSAPAVMHLDEIRITNTYFANIKKKYPSRFAALASVAPLGGKLALDEMERAIHDLGLNGAIICATVEGQPLDSRELWPFYEKMSELNATVFIHPSEKPPGFDALRASYDLFRTIGREFDLALATFRLCAGGVLNDFPDLNFVVAHFGGGYSSIKERMDRYIKVMGANFWYGEPLIVEPFYENYNKYFNRLYFNMAGREIGIQTVKCALTNINPQRLLFGTDYPPNFIDDAEGMRAYIDEIKKLNLSIEDVDAMLGANAIKLFKLI